MSDIVLSDIQGLIDTVQDYSMNVSFLPLTDSLHSPNMIPDWPSEDRPKVQTFTYGADLSPDSSCNQRRLCLNDGDGSYQITINSKL